MPKALNLPEHAVSDFGLWDSLVIRHSAFVTLFQRQGRVFLRSGAELVARDDARTGVPAQQRVVIAPGANLLGFFKPQHGLAEQFERVEAGAGSAVIQLSLGLALANDASVVGSLVFVAQAGEQFLR